MYLFWTRGLKRIFILMRIITVEEFSTSSQYVSGKIITKSRDNQNKKPFI